MYFSLLRIRPQQLRPNEQEHPWTHTHTDAGTELSDNYSWDGGFSGCSDVVLEKWTFAQYTVLYLLVFCLAHLDSLLELYKLSVAHSCFQTP